MKNEIERKFLVDKKKWNLTEKPAGNHYRQGYLLTDPEKSIRVRTTDLDAYLTIKGKTIGATKPEYEYEIPLEDANDLLERFAVSEINKIRYVIIHGNKKWEVDEFLGDNSGLMIAEIELESEDEYFEIPEWAGKEVTADMKYYNVNLSINPFKNWNDISKSESL